MYQEHNKARRAGNPTTMHDIEVAAFTKLNIGTNTAHRETTMSVQAQRRAVLHKLNLELMQPSAGIDTTMPVGKSMPAPTNVDPLQKEYRRRLLELAQEAFPDGKVALPFKPIWKEGRK